MMGRRERERESDRREDCGEEPRAVFLKIDLYTRIELSIPSPSSARSLPHRAATRPLATMAAANSALEDFSTESLSRRLLSVWLPMW